MYIQQLTIIFSINISYFGLYADSVYSKIGLVQRLLNFIYTYCILCVQCKSGGSAEECPCEEQQQLHGDSPFKVYSFHRSFQCRKINLFSRESRFFCFEIQHTASDHVTYICMSDQLQSIFTFSYCEEKLYQNKIRFLEILIIESHYDFFIWPKIKIS